VDDEEGIRRVMEITLTDAGYQVFTAGDARDALALIEKVSPQIVITDIRMPGVDGLELLRTIKEEESDREVIVVTAFGEMELAIKALQLNASDFITKPINDDALFVAIERAKERYSNRRELYEYTSLLEEKWIKTADELSRTFNFQKKLIESSIDGIIGCERNGLIITFNRSMERISGFSKDEVIKKLRFETFLSPEALARFKDAFYSNDYGGRQKLYFYETNILDRDGNSIPVQINATALFEDREEVGMVCFVRDLREMKMLEEQNSNHERLLHQDKLISLGRLAASVVHEINNPLAGILNYIRLMKKKLKKEPVPGSETVKKFSEYLELVEGETERCSKIVSNLLAFSRRSELEFKRFNINELIEKCIILSKHKMDLQNIRVEKRLSSQIPEIMGDFNQIQQCLINLIFNAIDAMPNGGTLTIEIIHDRKDAVVQIKVMDTGKGISPEDISRIYEPFFTTKAEGQGLGLGLSTVKGIIERHKGKISVKSELGRGTEFTIQLPVNPER